jgi:predicted transcriptional regulator
MESDDFNITEYKITEDKIASIFGSLETQVMNTVWQHKAPVKVRDIYEELKKERKIAYTSVMTTMNNLYEKGVLDRDVQKGRGGLLYVYWPKLSRKEVESTIVERVLDSLIRNFSESVNSYLVENELTEPKKK